MLQAPNRLSGLERTGLLTCLAQLLKWDSRYNVTCHSEFKLEDGMSYPLSIVILFRDYKQVLYFEETEYIYD